MFSHCFFQVTIKQEPFPYFSSDEDDDVHVVSISEQRQPDFKLVWADTNSTVNTIAAWELCELAVVDCADEQTSYVVRCDDRELTLPSYKVADYMPIQKHHRCVRVVAIRRRNDLPYVIRGNQQMPLYPNIDGLPYPGIVGAQNGVQCMIIFDDGHVQNINVDYIFKVFGEDGIEHGKFQYENRLENKLEIKWHFLRCKYHRSFIMYM